MAAGSAKSDEIDVSTEFLKAYIAQGGKVVDKDSGGELDAENIDEFLKEASGGEQEQPQSRRKMRARVEKETLSDEEREAKARAKEEERQAAELAKKQEAKQKTIRGVIKDSSNSLVENVAPLADRIGSLSTVGGIGLLLVILVLLLFIIVQVNSQGDTRLKQLWFMVNGRTKLQGRVYPHGSSKEDFGTRFTGSQQQSDQSQIQIQNQGNGSNNGNNGGGGTTQFIPLLSSYRGNTPF